MHNDIVKELEKFLPKSDNQKSSHWKNFFLQNVDYLNIQKTFGFGSLEKKHFFYSPIHYFFQRLVFDKKIFKSNEYQMFKRFLNKQNRQIDYYVIRHIFTFNFLNKFKILKGNICSIGDGKVNCVGGLLSMNRNDIKIFSVNLTEVLIHDYLIIKNYNLLDDDSIVVVKNENDLKIKNKKLFLIDASNIHLLKNKNINLFINIASMQEMRPEIVEDYFNIIKSNKSFFYCCNREYKKLAGGEELFFDKYPWGNCKKIVFEDCPWHKKGYQFKAPFITNYDGNIKHSLVKYS